MINCVLMMCKVLAVKAFGACKNVMATDTIVSIALTAMVEVVRVELASKYVKHSVTTGLVDHCTLRSAGSRRPALHDFPFSTLWQGTGTTLAFETPIDAPLTDPGMDGPEER